MKIYKVTLLAKEIGSKNKIKFSFKVTQEGLDNLMKSNIAEYCDFPRKQMVEALGEAKIINTTLESLIEK